MPAGVIQLVDLRKCLQPGLTALLPHDAVGSPGSKSIVEALVGSPDGLLRRLREAGIVETSQVGHAVVGCRRHNPGVTPSAQRMSEAAVVLKPEQRLSRDSCRDLIPVDGVGKVHIEVGHDRTALRPHICGRRKVGLLDVLQLLDQSRLRRAARTGVPLDRPLIDHDRETEAGMFFRFSHHQLRGQVSIVIGAVPIDYDAIDAAADHIDDLAVHLCGIGGTVPDVHVVRASEPEHQMRVHLGCRAGIQQGVHIHSAHVAGGRIAISLIRETVRRTRIVRRLGG